jgi:beta-lactam-binding protein with PASTA domain
MRNSRPLALVLVLGLVVGLMAAIAGAAAAQTTQGRLAFVNGNSTDPVSVTVNGEELAADLAFATTSEAVVRESGAISVAFSDGSSLEGSLPAASAWTVVSGFPGNQGANAYPAVIEAIPNGQARVAVWNATNDTVLFSVNGGDPFELLAGEGLEPQLVPADQEFTVQVGADDAAQTFTYTPVADNYFDVFAVNDGATLGVANSVIPSMNDIIAAIGSPTVPDVVGQSQADAEQALIGAGYSVGTIEQPSDTVEAGLVIATQPSAGTELAVGELVTVVVSSGASTVAVPDVIGTSTADAQAALEAVGLTSTVEERPDNEVEAGLVLETNPAAGIEVAPGTNVIVVASAGPDDVVVPDFLGLTAAEANELAEATGVMLAVVEDPEDPDPDGLVVEQDPAAGETVAFGTEVTVQLSPATEEAWASIKLDPDRILTAAGINFEVGSVSETSVLTTDLSAKDVVDDSGYWLVTIDTTSLDPDLAYEVLITGTAEDGTAFEQIFDLPPVGQTVDVPQEEEGIPGWVWIILIVVIVALAIIGVLLVMDARSKESADADATPPPDAEEPSPPPTTDV